MCQTCYDRGYQDFPSYVGSVAHITDYNKGYGARASETGMDPEELRETNYCDKCYKRGVHDAITNVFSPPKSHVRGHYESYMEGYESQKPKSKYKKPPIGSNLPEMVRVIIGMIAIALVVGIVWFVFKIAIPVILLNIAILALVCAFLIKDRKNIFYILSVSASVYIIAEHEHGWQSETLAENATSLAGAIPVFYYVNIIASLVAAYFLIRNQLNKNNPAEDENEFSKRNVILMICLIAAGAAIIVLQQHAGHGTTVSQNNPLTTEPDKRWPRLNKTNSELLTKIYNGEITGITTFDSCIHVTISNFEATKLKKYPDRALPIYNRAKQVKQYSDECYNYMKDIKDELYKEGGGINQSTGLVSNWLDTDIVARIMIKEGRAIQLKEQIEQVRNKLHAAAGSEPIDGVLFINTYGPTGDNHIIYSWENYLFGTGATLATAINDLTRLQGELRHSESEILMKILGVTDLPTNGGAAPPPSKEQEVPPPQNGVTASGPKAENTNGIDPGIVNNNPGAPPPAVFSYVEQMPVSGYDLLEYESKNIHYPDAARENNISGRVIVKFIVNEDGSISNTQILRGIGGGCDEEALRVISIMPKWKPGKQNGRPVKVYFTLPVNFKLE